MIKLVSPGGVFWEKIMFSKSLPVFWYKHARMALAMEIMIILFVEIFFD